MMYSIYHSIIPEYVKEIMNTQVFQRLQDVGMNCGLEYTSFEPFSNCKGVSRYDHSIGVALITYHFTQDKHATVAALLHDIATPVFAHVIDFLHQDHEKQESTESKTKEIIDSSNELQMIFQKYAIDLEKIYDYHQYPIADNDSPQLSADRLEYTLSNAYHYKLLSLEQIQMIYDDLIVNDSQDEIIFQDEKLAVMLTEVMLQCSRLYTCDEDRYCMEYLAILLKDAIDQGGITEQDLYTQEQRVIHLLCQHQEMKIQWEKFCQFNQIDQCDHPKEGYLKVKAKHRYFNPLVGQRRIIDQHPNLQKQLELFLQDTFDRYIKAYIKEDEK